MRLAAPVDPPPVEDALAPIACPRCDYPLDGLAAAGTCPECGRGYGPPEVCLYGYAMAAAARTPRKAVGPTTRRNLAWLWGIGLLSLGFNLAILRHAPLPLPGRAWIIVCVLFTPALITWRARADRGSGLTQVVLGPAGVRQGTRGLGPVPYDRADRVPLTPWTAIGRATVRPVGEGQVRVTLSADAPWWRFRRDYVSAVVRCPAGAAAVLALRVEQWHMGLYGAGDEPDDIV